MAKERVELLRGVRMPAERSEGGKVLKGGRVVTDAEELDKETLKAAASKGYVAGMEPEAEALEPEKKSSRKGK